MIEKAIELYLQATIQDPGYFQAFCNMGSCYKMLRKYMESQLSYKQALKIKADDIITIYNLANLYRIIGNDDKAVE